VTFPIALEEFEAAYAATGLEPADGCFLSKDRLFASPLGAVYVRSHGQETIAQVADLYDVFDGIRSALGLTYFQALNFTLGFDGKDPEEIEDFEAYEVGCAARARFLLLQPPEA
jgi:hypothetical protein